MSLDPKYTPHFGHGRSTFDLPRFASYCPISSAPIHAIGAMCTISPPIRSRTGRDALSLCFSGVPSSPQIGALSARAHASALAIALFMPKLFLRSAHVSPQLQKPSSSPDQPSLLRQSRQRIIDLPPESASWTHPAPPVESAESHIHRPLPATAPSARACSLSLSSTAHHPHRPHRPALCR